MKVHLAGLIFASAFFLASAQDEAAINALIKKLASANFQERQQAAKALQELPEAAPALRNALRSKDREVANRAADILDYFDRAPLRQLNKAVKEGRVERAIELLGDWPTGKYDTEVWLAARELARTIDGTYQKQAGMKKGWIGEWDQAVLIAEKCFTEQHKNYKDGNYMIRSAEVDIEYARLKPPNTSNRFATSEVFFVVAKSARLSGWQNDRTAIFANGSVEVRGNCASMLILSGDDAVFDGDIHNSLIIARGKVILVNGLLQNCRIITGESIVGNKKRIRQCTISENDTNPLGFIRWSAAPKEKAAPTKKVS